MIVISIHALRGEGDTCKVRTCVNVHNFNPRPPWGGRRLATGLRISDVLFQSTPSVGRATQAVWRDINRAAFQSTPSVGRATRKWIFEDPELTISIHALRGEGDRFNTLIITHGSNFNPRPPWGGRRGYSPLFCSFWKFQSTPSVGRATNSANRQLFPMGISIHALRGEGDVKKCLPRNKPFGISIHALRGEGDAIKQLRRRLSQNFNPRPPWGGRPVVAMLLPII